MARYWKDPYWLTARFGQCEECKTPLRGKQAFYYPKTKTVYCEDCGDKHSRDFESCKFDEDQYNSQYPSY